MKRLFIFYGLLIIGLGVLAQSKQGKPSITNQNKKLGSDSLRKADTGIKKQTKHKKIILRTDTLIMSDYIMSIDRVNDNLNAIRDSTKLEPCRKGSTHAYLLQGY
jgi:hypothetical protein